MQLFSADAVVFSKKKILIPKVDHNGLDLFISQSSQDHSPQPRIDFSYFLNIGTRHLFSYLWKAGKVWSLPRFWVSIRSNIRNKPPKILKQNIRPCLSLIRHGVALHLLPKYQTVRVHSHCFLKEFGGLERSVAHQS